MNRNNKSDIDADGDDEGVACRYCLGKVDVNSGNAHRPCDCRSYVHDDCLNRWLRDNNNNNNNNNNNANRNVCEICHSEFAILVSYDKKCECGIFKRHVLNVLLIIYLVINVLLMPFATIFVILGLSLLDNNSELFAIPITILSIIAFVLMFLPPFGFFFDAKNCDFVSYISPKLPDNLLARLALNSGVIYCGICIIIQGLSLVIANPILGRPIAFTPRGETFGIMLAILIGICLIAFIIHLIVLYIKRNCIVKTRHIEYQNKEVV